ncbi:CU044_5270 family protein [Streptomyces sp. NPDC002004]
MDEMTQVKELRADAPLPDRGRLAPGRARLVETAKGGRRPRTVWARQKFVIAAGVAAVTAVAVAASVLADRSDSDRTVRPAVSPGMNLKGLSAPGFLRRAAAEVEQQGPVTVPRAKQWIYVKGIQEDSRPEVRRHIRASEEWIRYDGGAIADIPPFPGAKLSVRTMHLENGGEGDDRSPREMYRFLSTLPADGEKTLAAIRTAHAIGDVKGETRGERDYREISVLLDADVMPSTGLAGLYRALATLPGGKVSDHLVKSATGRRVIALRYERSGGGKQGGAMADEWLFDPQTYRVVGQRFVQGGEVLGGSSTLTTAVVDKAGQRS